MVKKTVVAAVAAAAAFSVLACSTPSFAQAAKQTNNPTTQGKTTGRHLATGGHEFAKTINTITDPNAPLSDAGDSLKKSGKALGAGVVTAVKNPRATTEQALDNAGHAVKKTGQFFSRFAKKVTKTVENKFPTQPKKNTTSVPPPGKHQR